MPIAVTELCMAPHQQYQLKGRLRVRIEDGTAIEANPETTAVPRASCHIVNHIMW